MRIEDEDNNIAPSKIRRQDDVNLPSEFLLLDYVNVKVRYRVGDEVEEDASCDSNYILSAVNHLGEAIRKAYHWIHISQKCYLAVDNVGGHSTNETITSYTEVLNE